MATKMCSAGKMSKAMPQHKTLACQGLPLIGACTSGIASLILIGVDFSSTIGINKQGSSAVNSFARPTTKVPTSYRVLRVGNGVEAILFAASQFSSELNSSQIWDQSKQIFKYQI
jgi:hypothetical protein